MKAKLTISLSLVVATLGATTWFFKDHQAAQAFVPVSQNTFTNEQSDVVQIEGQYTGDQLIKFDKPVDQLNEIYQEPVAIQKVTRVQAIDDLQSKFRLLETQYGILSVDDIQILEASLVDIDDVNNLVDLSDALDDLLDQ